MDWDLKCLRLSGRGSRYILSRTLISAVSYVEYKWCKITPGHSAAVQNAPTEYSMLIQSARRICE